MVLVNNRLGLHFKRFCYTWKFYDGPVAQLDRASAF